MAPRTTLCLGTQQAFLWKPGRPWHRFLGHENRFPNISTLPKIIPRLAPRLGRRNARKTRRSRLCHHRLSFVTSSATVWNSLTRGGRTNAWTNDVTYPAPRTGLNVVIGADTKAARTVRGWASARIAPRAHGVPLARIQKRALSPAAGGPWGPPVYE